MRVLHCIPSMAGGGSERQLALLADGESRAGVAVVLALLHSGPNLPMLERTGAAVVRPKALGNYDPQIIVGIVRAIREHRIDLVQTWLPQMDVMGGLAALWVGVPYIVSERSCLLAYPPSAKHALRVTIGRHANAIVANSFGGLDYWRGKNDRPLNRVVRNVVSIDSRIGALEREMEETNQEPRRRLLYAGRYIPSKNLVNLLKALALVFPKFPDVIAEFCGEGSLKGELLQERDRLGIASRVTIGGYVDPLVAKLKGATLFISPSSFEGSPNAVIEAAACGCGLVVSDIPAHREFLDDTCAYFVDCNSPGDIARGIEHALSHPDDAREKAAAARDRVSGWTVEAITGQYVDLYKDVLRECGATATLGR